MKISRVVPVLFVASVVFLSSMVDGQETPAQQENQDSDELSLADVFVENWRASQDSIVSFHADLRVFRYRFSKSAEGFDISGFATQAEEALQDSEFDQFMKETFDRLYPNGQDSTAREMVWDHKVTVSSTKKRERVLWLDAKKEVFFDYLNTPIMEH